VAGLKFNIYAINKISTAALESKIIADYLKRIPWEVLIYQLELKGSFPPEKQKLLEGELILKSLSSNSFVIALDERGEQYNSSDFAKKINNSVKPISFLIGGAFGLSQEVKRRADMVLSLGLVTIPHALARVLLVEQIYRAYTIGQNHPYHK
jgi:23S rRNA (pseudouridine1915-N3)-methyltransferase